VSQAIKYSFAAMYGHTQKKAILRPQKNANLKINAQSAPHKINQYFYKFMIKALKNQKKEINLHLK
jgi:hypothetical protein